MFQVPSQIDYTHLVETVRPDPGVPALQVGPAGTYRQRDGFDLTDRRFGPRRVMSEVDYCILCHERDKDSCSKGMPEGAGFRKNPLGFVLKGCPLGQRISESHALKGQGDVVGALALIMIDNPMLPGTGHRICNDCMKSCIFQRQTPVNIPQVETGILTDVLTLPWGFEIYSLLTRWNPLNIQRPFMLPYNGKNVLVVGATAPLELRYAVPFGALADDGYTAARLVFVRRIPALAAEVLEAHAAEAALLLVHNSDFYSNTLYGLYNANPGYTLVANGNWWGSSTLVR